MDFLSLLFPAYDISSSLHICVLMCVYHHPLIFDLFKFGANCYFILLFLHGVMILLTYHFFIFIFFLF
ncbi:hypothetical protein BDZ91DRAFT_117344 [Kalaharituber pfeilii]|nr:hypothetical protein BDZ91DRAFT_117344 [Kalaharituber pfeilii]